MRALVAALVLAGSSLLAAFPGGSAAVDAQTPTAPRGQRAVVLAGGGSTGSAWEIGVLKGLRDAGIDLSQADVVIGTSAGAIVGSQVRGGRSLDELYEARLAPPATASGVDPRIDVEYFRDTSRLWAGVESTPELRMAVGQRALEATQVVPEDEAVERRARTLGVADWPSQPLQITAIDVLDGTTRLIDKTQGVPIARAVAASTALPGFSAPVTIGDRRYMDGGVGGAHLDAAAGYRLVVGVVPGGGPTTVIETEGLRAQGSQVVTVRPDAEAAEARGPDSRDLTRLRGSAEAGLRQGAAVAADLAGLWNGASPSP